MGFVPKAAATLLTASVTVQFFSPALIRRSATSAAVQAALRASARGPVTGFSSDAPTTSVSALTEAKPSMCAPTWILITSSFDSVNDESVSELRGRGQRLDQTCQKTTQCEGNNEREGREMRYDVLDTRNISEKIGIAYHKTLCPANINRNGSWEGET
jgi:hypothetical protein